MTLSRIANTGGNPSTLKAFAFMVTHEDDGEHLSGAVWCADQDNDAGLAPGWNDRSMIGRGGPVATCHGHRSTEQRSRGIRWHPPARTWRKR
jgi:hypothetical protein